LRYNKKQGVLDLEKKYLLFDLDGTLTDPKIGITKSFQYALKAFGIVVDDLDELLPCIGPPLRDSFKELYSFSDEEAEWAVAKYREYFSEQGIFENALYSGIPALLSEQVARGRKLIVATSKVTAYAKRILEHFGIAKYFAFVAGSEMDGRRSDKAEVIRYALESMNITEIRKAVMIGDRKYDILGAKELGMDSIVVLYGYGSRGELESVEAGYIAVSVEALSELLK
jgi:phosphoglycolate phosphatase